MMKESFFTGVVFIPADTIDYSAGGIVSKQILHSDAGSVTLFSFDDGQGLSEHEAPFDALVQSLEGEAEIVLDGKPLRLGPGESLIMPAGVRHSVLALTRFKMLLTMIRG